MKVLINTFILSMIFLFTIDCKKEINSTKDRNPIITNLSNGDAFELGSLIPISVDIDDNEADKMKELKLLINNIQVVSSSILPIEYTWKTKGEEIGKQLMQFVFTDITGNTIIEDVLIRLYIVNNQPCPCSTVVDYDGNIYNTILIGDQCWMKENLKVIHYADGTSLVDGTGAGNTQYDTLTKYYFNYNDDESFVETYGRLYIWKAAVNGYSTSLDLNPSQIQGVCPDGWHLPSDSEWKELEMFLGMSQKEVDDREWRGTIEGGMLKESGTNHWEQPNISATNESGFSALPAGHRTMIGGDFYSMGTKASFWSSTNHISVHNNQNPAFRLLHNNEARTYRYRGTHGLQTFARSVRCVKD